MRPWLQVQDNYRYSCCNLASLQPVVIHLLTLGTRVSAGSYTVTVTGTDLAGNAFGGTESITITVDASVPTVTLSDTDSDNLLGKTDVVTITASFSEAMTATPTISISGHQ